MTDAMKIKEWANERLSEVESKIARLYGFSENFYQDLIAKRVVLKDLIYFIDTMYQEIDDVKVREKECLENQLDEAYDLIIKLVDADPSELCRVVDTKTNWCEKHCEDFNRECLKLYFRYKENEI